MKNVIFLIFTLLFLISCGSKKIDQGVYKRSHSVTDSLTSNLKTPWHILNKKQTDIVLENKITKSLFLFSSACRSYESSSLKQLSSSLITGLDDLNIIHRKETTHQDRAAIEMRFDAKIDGVKRSMQTLTILKNFCIYDYSLISKNAESLKHDLEDYKEFLNLIILN